MQTQQKDKVAVITAKLTEEGVAALRGDNGTTKLTKATGFLGLWTHQVKQLSHEGVLTLRVSCKSAEDADKASDVLMKEIAPFVAGIREKFSIPAPRMAEVTGVTMRLSGAQSSHH